MNIREQKFQDGSIEKLDFGHILFRMGELYPKKKLFCSIATMFTKCIIRNIPKLNNSRKMKKPSIEI